MTENGNCFEVNIEQEKTQVLEGICLAIADAPPLRIFRSTNRKISNNRYTYDEVRGLPGIIIYDDPHIYGLAITTLIKISGTSIRDVLVESFSHEMDHFNESKEFGLEAWLCLAFGASYKRIGPDFGVTFKGLECACFSGYVFPCDTDKRVKQMITTQILSAPEIESKDDHYKLTKLKRL
jgi:hypothetical protein